MTVMTNAGQAAGQATLSVVGVQVLAALAVLLAARQEFRLRRWLPFVVSGAVGVLLATGLGHLLPDGMRALGNRPALWLTFGLTILGFYGLERLVHRVSGVRAEPSAESAAQECHEVHAHMHAHGVAKPSALLVGAFTHSFVDGASIAAAFAADVRVGWVTALAVGLHEVPHRVGDFALLLHMDFGRTRAMLLAMAAGTSSLLGLGAVLALGEASPQWIGWLLPFSAGSFVYISLFDLLPETFGGRTSRQTLAQLAALVAGALLALALTALPGA